MRKAMIKINWDEFKYFKESRIAPEKEDNFPLLLDFIRSFYNIHSPYDIYDMCVNDPLAKMMLDKRGISEPETLEDYLFKTFKL